MGQMTDLASIARSVGSYQSDIRTAAPATVSVSKREGQLTSLAPPMRYPAMIDWS